MKKLKPRAICIGLFLLFIMAFAVFQTRTAQKNSEEDFVYHEIDEMNEFDASAQPEKKQAEIVVHVAGAVAEPGVYTLREGQRVEDALELAGICDDSDVDALNRAALLADGQKIIVPSLSEITSGAGEIQKDALIDLNQADLNQLMTLPGIGEVKAQAILEYRMQQGLFHQVEDIQKVNGIGKSIYDQIKNKIKI